jgi:hypothetical protein
MIKLVFKEDTNYVDPNASSQPARFERFRELVNEAVSPLKCPNHGTNSYSTIMLSFDFDNSNWEIIDSCCSDFAKVVESEMPFPWSHARRHQKS